MPETRLERTKRLQEERDYIRDELKARGLMNLDRAYKALGETFGTSEKLLMNLDRAYRQGGWKGHKPWCITSERPNRGSKSPGVGRSETAPILPRIMCGK